MIRKAVTVSAEVQNHPEPCPTYLERGAHILTADRLSIVERLRELAQVQRESAGRLREEAIALKAAGKDWSITFEAEGVAHSKRAALLDAAELLEKEIHAAAKPGDE